MSNVKRVLVVFGTRPEGIKMAPVVAALRAHPALEPVVAVTGQHGAMLTQVLDLFGITPDVDLGLHTPGQTLAEITARAMSGLAPVLRDVAPDAVVVQGDTTTTLTAALAGFYAQRPVVHVEAGLRTHDLLNPFPEEANRRMTSRIASLHLAATAANRDALLAEGIAAETISVTGNTVIDAVLTATSWNVHWDDPALAVALGARRRGDRRTVLVTAHRRESWGEPLVNVARAIGAVAAAHPHVQFVWPLHANPAVQRWVRPVLAELANVVLTGPAGYRDFARLMSIADIAVTDSGGVQEEAPALGVPVLVTREITERQEAVDCGAARLVGTDPTVIAHWLTALIGDSALRASMRVPASPYGDGRAAARTAAAVAAMLDVGSRLPDFVAPAYGFRDEALDQIVPLSVAAA
jgi:UDP-N-acetylglucosamine 2-epimerase (non-hydrolysing)